ncbi:MAG TPA: hypothetical protein VF444_13810 [Pseudonocardiaceae bacterium]
MAELGETNDPNALVPGDPNSIYHTVSALRTYGDLLTIAGKGLERVDTSDGWSGQAADAFRNVFDGQPNKWLHAGDAFHDAAKALDDYAPTLSWAQQQASVAIGQWNSGEANHQQAQSTLSRAREQLASAGDTAAAAVGRARDLAPPKPGFWSQLGDDVGSFFSDVGHDLETAGADVLNTAASVGNAMIHDPGDTLAMVGGLALAGVSGLGDGAGAVLDVTGVGAIAGVPLNVVSTAGVVGGLSLAGVGAAGILQNAAGPDRVNIMNSDSGGGWGGGGVEPDYQTNPGSIASKTGYSRRQINDAIHGVKSQGGWRGLGANKNPDVVVDVNTGEVYPQLPDGSPSEDSIGNIFEYLERDSGG